MKIEEEIVNYKKERLVKLKANISLISDDNLMSATRLMSNEIAYFSDYLDTLIKLCIIDSNFANNTLEDFKEEVYQLYYF